MWISPNTISHRVLSYLYEIDLNSRHTHTWPQVMRWNLSLNNTLLERVDGWTDGGHFQFVASFPPKATVHLFIAQHPLNQCLLLRLSICPIKNNALSLAPSNLHGDDTSPPLPKLSSFNIHQSLAFSKLPPGMGFMDWSRLTEWRQSNGVSGAPTKYSPKPFGSIHGREMEVMWSRWYIGRWLVSIKLTITVTQDWAGCLACALVVAKVFGHSL